MSEKAHLPRYQVWINSFQGTKIYRWMASLRTAQAATWRYTRGALWTISAAAIILLLPLAIEATVDGELKAQELSSQIGGGGMNPDVQYRSY
jgi:hypothetical protein